MLKRLVATMRRSGASHHRLVQRCIIGNAGGAVRSRGLRRNAEIDRVAGLLTAGPTEKLPRTDISNPFSSCSKAPAPHNATARKSSYKDLRRESPQVALAEGANPNHVQPLFGRPSQSQKQRDTHRDELSARHYANISLPSRDAYDKENCSRPRYPESPQRRQSPALRHRRPAT